MAAYLSPEQVAVLLRPIKPGRVSKDRDGMSHLQAYDVRAHLNRVLGFARWSAEVLDVTPLFETLDTIPQKSGNGTRDVVSVGYRATLRLAVCAADGTVLAVYTECATGDASNFPMAKRADAHDFAIKTSESQALKRCATNLGDQFGLSLYAKGSTDAVVRQTLIGTDTPAAHEPESVEPESDGRMHPVAGVNPQTGEIVQAEVGRSSQPGQVVDVTDPSNQAAAQQLGNAQDRKATRTSGPYEGDVRWETLPADQAAEELRAQVREAALAVGIDAGKVPEAFDTRYPDSRWDEASSDALSVFLADLLDERKAMGA